MPVSPAFRPDQPYVELGAAFWDPVEPARFPAAVRRFRNRRWAERVGLGELTDTEWEAHFHRFRPLPGAQRKPVAMRYHGHQFRTYNPDLGDGRGFLYAQLYDAADGRLLDLGTKGSGQTPWSRAGDGRLTLKGGVREVLATEMLEALGVPTSKSFALYETGEALTRGDEPSPTRSAVLTRLSWSHVRFGSFQRFAYLDEVDRLRRLVDHVIEFYYPDLTDVLDRPTALLTGVVERTAELVARWTTAGFVHGVLNTDNMNVNGESFDYGPWRFLPHADPGFTAAYFDQTGLYAFGRQAEAMFWNLQQLAGTLSLLTDAAPLVAALNRFGDLWQAALGRAVVDRLGLRPEGGAADAALAAKTFAAISEGGERLRWEPLFFDWRCGLASERRALEGPRAEAYAGPAAHAFRDALSAYAPVAPERLALPCFARPDPEEMLLDEVEAIWAAIAQRDDWATFERKLARLAEAREAAAPSLTPP